MGSGGGGFSVPYSANMYEIGSILEHLGHASKELGGQRLLLLVLSLAFCMMLVRIARCVVHVEVYVALRELTGPLSSIVCARSTTLHK